MAGVDPISAFTADGMRWVLGTLRARAEVASVMEQMLDTVEYWKVTVDADRLKFELEQARKEIERMRVVNAELEEARAAQQHELERDRSEAKEARSKLTEDLQALARDLKAKEVLQRRVNELQKNMERIPTLERELQKTQKDLKDAQKRLGHFKAYAGRGAAGVGGRQSPAALDKLLLGDGLPAPPPSSTRTYISVAETHSFFTTFMTLEEKLLLKVFSYLNAVDVLATAEVCRAFYDRVGAIFGKPGTASPPPTTPSASSASGAGSSGAGGSSPSPDAPLPSSRASAAAKAVLDESPITDKVATSIASKLTSAEMKGIIGLTEKLKKLEAVVLQMQAENEDLRARLQGTESVKDFLISKLKDTEVALKKSLDGTSGAARQRASDQEVISFLDGRVQELEQALQETSDKLTVAQDQQHKDKLAFLEKIRYLDDSLQFERHKLEEKEAEFRAQKRILAKEIKTLRSEVLARQAERDSYKEQLKELRQSIAKVGRGTR